MLLPKRKMSDNSVMTMRLPVLDNSDLGGIRESRRNKE